MIFNQIELDLYNQLTALYLDYGYCYETAKKMAYEIVVKCKPF